MRTRLLILGIVWAGSLCGQHHRFSWQDACFKNPALPYCIGNDVAVKHARTAKDPAHQGDVATTLPVAGPIDWRFADPHADALAGFNFGVLAASPLGRGLIARLGAVQGLTEADMEKVFSGLSVNR